MNNSMNLPIIVSLLMALVDTAHSQASDPSIILYNSQPVKVELSEAGKILSYYGLVTGYMEGYDLGEAASAVVSEPVVANVNPTFDNDSQNAEYDIISKERVILDFPAGFATLSGTSISSLNNISARLKSGENKKVVVTAYKQESEPQKLVQNRLESIVSYLRVKGIMTSQILTEIQSSTSLDNSVAVNYVN